MVDDELRYELFVLPRIEDGSSRKPLGRYGTYRPALHARDDDVLRQLREAGGWYSTIEHVIVGPGLAGAHTERRHSTAIGLDPCAGRQPAQVDLLEAADWLRSLRFQSLED
jgi:hypothetical protein